jgi:predicted AAA+ superfamily ATPase
MFFDKWNTIEVLKNGAMAGAFFESFVVSEIIKSYYNKGILEPPIYFYRDKDMNEIDLIIEDAGGSLSY